MFSKEKACFTESVGWEKPRKGHVHGREYVNLFTRFPASYNAFVCFVIDILFDLVFQSGRYASEVPENNTILQTLIMIIILELKAHMASQHIVLN